MDLEQDQGRSVLRETVREFVRRELPPHVARAFDTEDQYPHGLLQKLSDLGLMGVTIPRAYGGLGGNVQDVMVVYEEISRGLPVLAWVVGNICLYGNEIIGVNGSQEQKEQFLPQLAQGKLKFAFALTEPNAGSDAANVSTRAVYQDGCYRISGQKMFITGAGVSDYVVTMARTGESRYNGLTAFIVDTRSEGYATAPIRKLGYHGSNTCAVHFDHVAVGPEMILGGPEGLNRGWSHMVRLLNSERLALSACALGMGQAALDGAVAYAREHYQFAGARGQHQGIQHRLVEMATELEAARRLAYHAAGLESQGRECVRETSMAKYFATETAKKICLQGLNIMGRDGASLEHDMQRYLRDVVILSIGGGTTEIQKNIIGKTMGL